MMILNRTRECLRIILLLLYSWQIALKHPFFFSKICSKERLQAVFGFDLVKIPLRNVASRILRNGKSKVINQVNRHFWISTVMTKHSTKTFDRII